jgi:hypothetical protein
VYVSCDDMSVYPRRQRNALSRKRASIARRMRLRSADRHIRAWWYLAVAPRTGDRDGHHDNDEKREDELEVRLVFVAHGRPRAREIRQFKQVDFDEICVR